MTLLHYHPAGDSGWLAVADGARLLLVHPDAEARVDALWSAVSEGAQPVLDELTRQGITATPSFALLGWTVDGSLRVIVRGPVWVTVSAPAGDIALDGAAVSTWTEQLIAGATSFDVTVDAAAVPLPLPLPLPLKSGVVFASRVVSFVGPAAPTTVPSVVPSVRPEPVSEATIAEFPAAVTPTDAAETPADDGYDYLFGATMFRNVAAAAVRDPEEGAADAAAETPANQGAAVGDHDGMTIMTGDLKKLRGNRATATPVAPVVVEEAPILYLELSTGGREALSQPVLVGRAPTATKVSGGSLPKLVTIPGDKDISRNHAKFTVEGGTVVVTDLHSRNGTMVSLPGKPPQQLRQGEPTSVIVGTVVDLGGGVTLTVCEQA